MLIQSIEHCLPHSILGNVTQQSFHTEFVCAVLEANDLHLALLKISVKQVHKIF